MVMGVGAIVGMDSLAYASGGVVSSLFGLVNLPPSSSGFLLEYDGDLLRTCFHLSKSK